MTYRVVLDTNVIVAGLRSSSGASHQLLRAIPNRQFECLLSVPLFFEYESVLHRQDTLAQTGLAEKDILVLLDVWAAVCKPVKFHYLWRPMLRDPSDEMVLETAVNGAADFLVTFNLRDFSLPANLFDFEVVTPAQFLGCLEKKI